VSAQSSAVPAAKASKLPWIIVAVLLLVLAGGAGWWFMQSRAAPEGEAAEKTAKAPSRSPAQYYALEPAFVVNLADTDAVRYLQADVQIMTRDPATSAALELHTPAIRNRLLLLFGQQSAEQLAQRSAKERLQEKALAEVVAVLRAESAADKVEAVLFTSLVTQ
jgi:flagellar FliL protein